MDPERVELNVPVWSLRFLWLGLLHLAVVGLPFLVLQAAYSDWTQPEDIGTEYLAPVTFRFADDFAILGYDNTWALSQCSTSPGLSLGECQGIGANYSLGASVNPSSNNSLVFTLSLPKQNSLISNSTKNQTNDTKISTGAGANNSSGTTKSSLGSPANFDVNFFVTISSEAIWTTQVFARVAIPVKAANQPGLSISCQASVTHDSLTDTAEAITLPTPITSVADLYARISQNPVGRLISHFH